MGLSRRQKVEPMHKQFRYDAGSKVGPRAALGTKGKMKYPPAPSQARMMKEYRKGKRDIEDTGEDWYETQRKKARKDRGLNTDDESEEEEAVEDEGDEEAIEARKKMKMEEMYGSNDVVSDGERDNYRSE